jgi:hypothetical protein
MAPLDPVFEIAAAHNITPRLVATWNTTVPRTPRVMVPIQLDALVVRQAGGTWANCLMSAPPDPPPNSPPDAIVPRLSLLPPPFQELAAESRPPGVYLHWALPDGLTRATIPGPSDPGTTPDPTTQAEFPQIPDRWLVVRMFPSPQLGPRRTIQGWVLRAGEKAPIKVSLDQWNEPGTVLDTKKPLTAAGHGDPAWAAYYDNVVNRLAFYDDLTGVTSGPLAYLVCGWYSDPSADPLGTTIRSLNEFDQRMVELGWELATGELDQSHAPPDQSYAQRVKAFTMVELPTREAFTIQAPQALGFSQRSNVEQIPPIVDGAGSSPAPLDVSGHPQGGTYATNGAWWPSLTVCHGSVVGIGWPGIGFPGSENGLLSGETGGPPQASGIRAVFANTLAEALGEVIAVQNNNADEGRALEAFMLGALSEFEQADGAARVDARLHANAFGSLSGGETTETITLPDRSGTPPLPSQPVQSAPGIFPTSAPSGNRFKVKGGPVILEVPRASAQAQFINERLSENTILKGGLLSVVNELGPPAFTPPAPQRPVQVKRSLPRFFYPADPVFLLQGAGRSFKHGADGRFSEDGKLVCRLTGFALTELACSSITGGPLGRPSTTGDDVLERGIENGSVPPECEDLLREAVLLDPGASVSAAQVSTGFEGAQLISQAKNFAVQQTAWWSTWDHRTDPGPLIAKSGYAGMLPSPVSVTPPVRPWTPLHLDWEIQFIPSADGPDDWQLDEIDYLPDLKNLPAAGDTKSGFILQGRSLLTGGGATTIAASVRNTLKQASQAGGAASLPPRGTFQFASATSQILLATLSNVDLPLSPSPGAIDRTALEDVANALENMDVLVGALDNFHTRLRGFIPGDGTSTQPPATLPAGTPKPTPFLAMRSGFVRLRRLRLVDCFGQFVDLAGSSDTTLADPNQWTKSEPVHIAGREDLAAIPPRFTSPTRLWFRFREASGQDQDATDTINPVAGYMLPNHLDGALEFFDNSGTNLGVVRPDPAAGVVWEEAPGQPSTLGKSPVRAITNSFLGGAAQGLVDWGVADATPGAAQTEDALSALLRILDSTLWSIDPFGHVGDEHLALLVGHPVAVLRAQLRLEVKEPVSPDLVKQTRIPVRIGALVHWQDGLMGYFVNDDYRTLYCADAAVAGFARQIGPGQGFLQQINQVPDYYQQFANDLGAGVNAGNTPVTHPYVNTSGVLMIQPDQTINLTLLVEPHSVVHATSGLTPRKEIGVRRNWVADALAKLSPTFRFGPVMVDPKRIRMPVSGDIQGVWSWDHRSDVATWTEDSVVNSRGDAAIPPDPTKGQEGWLRLVPKPQG